MAFPRIRLCRLCVWGEWLVLVGSLVWAGAVLGWSLNRSIMPDPLHEIHNLVCGVLAMLLLGAVVWLPFLRVILGMSILERRGTRRGTGRRPS